MRNNKLIFIILLSLSNIAPHSAFANEVQDITITGAWIREAPPTVSTLAAYAKIMNQSNEKKILTSVSSPTFTRIELHLSKLVDGMAQMKKQDSLMIEAENYIELSPGAYHLMLFNPDRPLKAGDNVIIHFNFSDGSSSIIETPVKKRISDAHNHHHH